MSEVSAATPSTQKKVPPSDPSHDYWNALLRGLGSPSGSRDGRGVQGERRNGDSLARGAPEPRGSKTFGGSWPTDRPTDHDAITAEKRRFRMLFRVQTSGTFMASAACVRRAAGAPGARPLKFHSRLSGRRQQPRRVSRTWHCGRFGIMKALIVHLQHLLSVIAILVLYSYRC